MGGGPQRCWHHAHAFHWGNPQLAEEYDAAQERGEVAGRQNNPGSQGYVGGGNMPATAADLNLRRDEIHDARKLRGCHLLCRK